MLSGSSLVGNWRHQVIAFVCFNKLANAVLPQTQLFRLFWLAVKKIWSLHTISLRTFRVAREVRSVVLHKHVSTSFQRTHLKGFAKSCGYFQFLSCLVICENRFQRVCDLQGKPEYIWWPVRGYVQKFSLAFWSSVCSLYFLFPDVVGSHKPSLHLEAFRISEMPIKSKIDETRAKGVWQKRPRWTINASQRSFEKYQLRVSEKLHVFHWIGGGKCSHSC